MRFSAAAAVLVCAPALMSAAPAPLPPLVLGSICGFAAPEATGGSTAPAPPPVLLKGYGTGGFPISNAAKEAQAFFDNGMQLGHAFAHGASKAAFKEAVRLDPDCAMCVWGEAWSRGPTINYGVDKSERTELAKLADHAAGLVKDETPKERALIAALQTRYRDGGNRAFAKAMEALARTYPDDSEIAILAADALMIDAPWDDRAKAAMLRPVALLEGVLKANPNDTGAIHFYIHATEVAEFPARAVPYAERLQSLSPAASHLVHMPSHTYYKVGRYTDAKRSNEDAAVIDRANAVRQGLAGPEGVWKLVYHAHNVHFGIGAAMMDGDGKGALALADPVLARNAGLTAKNGFALIVAASAYAAYGRYGEQEAVAKLADPGDKLAFAQAMWRYARGEAAARRGDAGAVRREAAEVDVPAADLRAFGDMRPQATALVKIARLVLLGRAAMLENQPAVAARHFRHAAELQQARLRTWSDPPLWWYPVDRSYAAALLADGQAERAAKAVGASLERQPHDPLSLVVRARAEAALGQTAQSGESLAQARKGWAGDPGAVAAALL